jgi:hypothetical protein
MAERRANVSVCLPRLGWTLGATLGWNLGATGAGGLAKRHRHPHHIGGILLSHWWILRKVSPINMAR